MTVSVKMKNLINFDIFMSVKTIPKTEMEHFFGPKLARYVFYAAKYHQIVAKYHLETFLMHFMAKQHCLAEIWPKTAIF